MIIKKESENKKLSNNILSLAQVASKAKAANPSVINATIGMYNDNDNSFYTFKAVKENSEAELISKVLYPSDDHSEGKTLRLKQQYFLVSASIQNIINLLNNENINVTTDTLASMDLESLNEFLTENNAKNVLSFVKIYPSTNWLGGGQLTKLLELNEHYLNTVWFSGHSHWKWYLQKYEDKANVYRSYDENGNPTCGWCVHVPSCASPIDSNGTSSRVSKGLESEGGIVDVYDNYIVVRGMVFKDADDTEYTNLYSPIGQYKLDTTLVNIPAKEVPDEPTNPEVSSEGYVRKEHFDLNTAKANGDLNLITDLVDDYVQIEVNNSNQSYWLRSPSWINTATECTLYVEDMIVTDASGNIIALPPYVGFYNRNFSQKVDQYRIVDGESLVLTESGSNKRAQFGSSSSYQGGQIFIRLKMKLKYS